MVIDVPAAAARKAGGQGDVAAGTSGQLEAAGQEGEIEIVDRRAMRSVNHSHWQLTSVCPKVCLPDSRAGITVDRRRIPLRPLVGEACKRRHFQPRRLPTTGLRLLTRCS